MSGQVPKGSSLPLPYLRNVPGLQWVVCRTLYAYAALKIKNGEVADLPRIPRTFISLEYFSDIIQSNVLVSHRNLEDRTDIGLTLTQIDFYAAMLNTLSSNVLVLPVEIYIYIKKFNVKWGDLISYKKSRTSYSDPSTKIKRDKIYDMFERWYEDRDKKWKGHGIFPIKFPNPKYILLPGENPKGNHSFLVLCELDTTRATKYGNYKVQIIDTNMGSNVMSSKSGKFRLSNANAGDIAQRLNSFFSSKFWHFEKATIDNLYLRKARQGSSPDCAVFTTLHMRHFCGNIPLFCGKYDLYNVIEVLRNELSTQTLIDFKAMARELPLSVYNWYLASHGHKWISRFPKFKYNQPGGKLYNLYPHAPKRYPPGSMPFTISTFKHDYIPPPPPDTRGLTDGCKDVKYDIFHVYGEVIKTGFGRGPAPNYKLIGLDRADMPDFYTIPIPFGMNAPDAIRLVWNDKNGTRTVVQFTLKVDG